MDLGLVASRTVRQLTAAAPWLPVPAPAMNALKVRMSRGLIHRRCPAQPPSCPSPALSILKSLRGADGAVHAPAARPQISESEGWRREPTHPPARPRPP